MYGATDVRGIISSFGYVRLKLNMNIEPAFEYSKYTGENQQTGSANSHSPLSQYLRILMPHSVARYVVWEQTEQLIGVRAWGVKSSQNLQLEKYGHYHTACINAPI